MNKLTGPQLRGLRSYLRLGGDKPSTKINLELVKKGLLQSRAFGHVLTTRGEWYAYQLTHDEEQELMGLLTHDQVIFQRSEQNTKLFRIHMTLVDLGLSQRLPSKDIVAFVFRCPL